MIELNTELRNGEITIYDLAGKEVFTKHSINSNYILLNKNDFGSGIFLIEIRADERKPKREKIVFID